MLAENLDIKQLSFILLYIVLEIIVKGYFSLQTIFKNNFKNHEEFCLRRLIKNQTI